MAWAVDGSSEWKQRGGWLGVHPNHRRYADYPYLRPLTDRISSEGLSVVGELADENRPDFASRERYARRERL